MMGEMDRKPRLFVYDRVEILVLMGLGVIIAAFSFTLGVHLGKKVSPKDISAEKSVSPIPTHGDKVPNRQEVAEYAGEAEKGAEEAMNQALHEEVQRQGIKLDQPRPTELPDKSAAEKSGHASSAPAVSTAPKAEVSGKFTLQVGSFPTIGEARALRDSLEAHGLKPFLKSAKVGGKGTWYRVFVGSFGSREEADQRGTQYQGKSYIESFVVTNSSE